MAERGGKGSLGDKRVHEIGAHRIYFERGEDTGVFHFFFDPRMLENLVDSDPFEFVNGKHFGDKILARG